MSKDNRGSCGHIYDVDLCICHWGKRHVIVLAPAGFSYLFVMYVYAKAVSYSWSACDIGCEFFQQSVGLSGFNFKQE